MTGLLARLRGATARRALIGTAVTYAGYVLSLASAPLLARQLGADGRGALAAIFVPVQLLSWLVFLGVPRSIALNIGRGFGIGRKQSLILASLGLGGYGCIALYALVGSLQDTLISATLIVSLSMLGAGFTHVASDALLARGRIGAQAFIRSLNLLLPSMIIVLLWLCKLLDLTSAIVATAAGQFLSVVVAMVFLHTLSFSRPAGLLHWKESLRFWSSNASDAILAKADSLLLASFGTLTALGQYAIALTLAGTSSVISQALGDASFASLIDTSDEASRQTLFRRRAALGLASTVAVGSIVVIATWGLSSWILGPDFGDIWPVVAILIVAQGLNELWRLAGYLSSAAGRAKDLVWASAGATVTFSACGLAVGLVVGLTPWMVAALLASACTVRFVIFAVRHNVRRSA